MLISKQKSEIKLAVILVVAVHTQITGTRDIILVESVHTCTTRPVDKGGGGGCSRGFTQTPVLTSKRFYIQCLILSVLLFEIVH